MWHDVDWVCDITVYPVESREPEYDEYDERRKEKTTWTDLN